MGAATFVDEAVEMARNMVARESRGPGDIDNAMSRLEARYGVPYSVFWSLRYKKPKTMDVDIFARIFFAYEAECERQQRLVDEERQATRAKSRLGRALLCAGDLLAGKED